ncbi:hypothetical protein DFH11DRAFT_1743126 [Phellopilus nigrolimitatus]|nr:hypothetical protein DFH11DRAFT_1743126 [Phellopilus nigrolimitatus]
MVRTGPTIHLPQSILDDHTRLKYCPLSLGDQFAAISIQLRDSTVPGISVRDAFYRDKLIKIVNSRRRVLPLVGRDEIRVCVNWPGYSHVTTTHQTLQFPIFDSTTLASLVGLVGAQLAKYMDVCSNSVVSADAQMYEIRCGPDGLTNNDVYIRGFNNTFDGVWQVDLDIRL